MKEQDTGRDGDGNREEELLLTLVHEDMGELAVNLRELLGITEDKPGLTPSIRGVYRFVRNAPQVVPAEVFDALKDRTQKTKQTGEMKPVFHAGPLPPEMVGRLPVDVRLQEMQEHMEATDERLERLTGLLEKLVGEDAPEVTAEAPKRKVGRPRKTQPSGAIGAAGTDT